MQKKMKVSQWMPNMLDMPGMPAQACNPREGKRQPVRGLAGLHEMNPKSKKKSYYIIGGTRMKIADKMDEF